jgi:hypothetical protein
VSLFLEVSYLGAFSGRKRIIDSFLVIFVRELRFYLGAHLVGTPYPREVVPKGLSAAVL